MDFYYRKETDKFKKQPNKYIIPSSGKAIRIFFKKGSLRDKRVIRVLYIIREGCTEVVLFNHRSERNEWGLEKGNFSDGPHNLQNFMCLWYNKAKAQWNQKDRRRKFTGDWVMVQNLDFIINAMGGHQSCYSAGLVCLSLSWLSG